MFNCAVDMLIFIIYSYIELINKNEMLLNDSTLNIGLLFIAFLLMPSFACQMAETIITSLAAPCSWTKKIEFSFPEFGQSRRFLFCYSQREQGGITDSATCRDGPASDVMTSGN